MKFNHRTILSKFVAFFIFSICLVNTDIKPANAAFQNLTPCKTSPAFAKRLKSAIKKLDNRLKLYTPKVKKQNF